MPSSIGERLDSVSNDLVRLMAEYYGRGPEAAKSYLNDDVLLCVFRGGLTAVEKTLAEGGEPELVRAVRLRFQELMSERFCAVVERAMERRVLCYHSQIAFDPDVLFELFLLGEDVGGGG